MTLHTCVSPKGAFRCGIHRPTYSVKNLRVNSDLESLGIIQGGEPYSNHANFPPGDVVVQEADWIYEIANPLPFRGTTFIAKSWADSKALEIDSIRLPLPAPASLSESLRSWQSTISDEQTDALFSCLPRPVLLTLAANSTDSIDLVRVAKMVATFVYDQQGSPQGLVYKKTPSQQPRAEITDYPLFKIVSNNPYLPDEYKKVMVLRPGAQGTSEIIGEWDREESHIFEYLRKNSYIPGGHYAANMADDAIRYRIADLTEKDMHGLRHLYHQRTYLRVAEELGLDIGKIAKGFSEDELENLRITILSELNIKDRKEHLAHDATLWGWNFGYDCAGSGYKLHASHQMIHQQFALIPSQVAELSAENGDDSKTRWFPGYCCGDLVADFISSYKEQYSSDFFRDYIAAINNNTRLDGNKDGEKSLVIYQDEHVLLFVPKAQTSQWELQLMTLAAVGNILEANTLVREAINKAMHKAMLTLTGLGAKMITTIEFSKRMSAGDNGQHLLYSFLPKLPDSPGAFSEAQLRWINGHYPEDFALACRHELDRQ